jgi:hypothetical protein
MKGMNCGKELQWNSDVMESELLDEEKSDDDDRVVGFYECTRCGYSYEIYSPSVNKMSELEFYKKEVKK